MDQCQCSATLPERYLSPSAIERAQSIEPNQRAGSGSPNDDANLLHVLVTKPVVASKPRDNIVFEGDMDLKTTFETSYEALAKMRLDCWKKYQESKQMSLSNQKHGKQHSPTTLVDNEDDVSARPKDTNSPPIRRERKHTRTKKQTHTNNIIGNSSSDVQAIGTPVSELEQKQAKSSHIVETRDSLQHRTVTGRRTVSGTKQSDGDEQQKSRRALEASRRSISMVGGEVPYGKANVATNTEAGSDYVDPDLSPIIVYDANMNRLERVGVRKRSKYRPSTSLRPGARGLFGDQSLEEEDEKKPKVEISKQQAEMRTHGAGKPSADKTDLFSTSSTPTNELNRKTRQTLNEQNIISSGDESARGLTYSHHNLHVDAKRKVKDNINMTDHIREHNIVTGGDEAPLDRRVGIYGQFTGVLSPTSQMIMDFNNEQEQDEATINKLNELEEAAAVEEIQRCTSGERSRATSKAQSHRKTNESRISEGKPETTTPTSFPSRQSRLHKTCQQQNFYLYENEYPEPKETEVKGGDKGSSPINGQHSPSTSTTATRGKYKNLFRESPDFIMTTGKFHELSAMKLGGSKSNGYHKQQIRQQSIESTQTSSEASTHHGAHSIRQSLAGMAISDSGGATDMRTSMTERNETPIDYYNDSRQSYNREFAATTSSPTNNYQCRVLKLDDDFEFVESRSGHKYFVEKPPSPVKR